MRWLIVIALAALVFIMVKGQLDFNKLMRSTKSGQI
jgi:hypothetical protein